MRKPLLTLLSLTLSLPLFAMTSTHAIENLTTVIYRSRLNMPIFFPKTVPVKSHQTYYASMDDAKNGYTIYIDSTKTCHGMHTCNIGMLRTEVQGLPVINYDMKDTPITVPVKLKTTTGYFTPAHAMGDFWPATLQWREHFVLHTLTWNLNASTAKKQLIKMANSMKRFN